jgi:hypothetical protein
MYGIVLVKVNVVVKYTIYLYFADRYANNGDPQLWYTWFGKLCNKMTAPLYLLEVMKMERYLIEVLHLLMVGLLTPIGLCGLK